MRFYKKIFSRFFKKDGDFFVKIEKMLGFSPKNITYYEEAFTHPSVTQQNKAAVNYQRLEFLGDAILGAVVAHYVFEKSPEQNEGYLTKIRSKMVQREHLNRIGRTLKLEQFLVLNPKSDRLGEHLHGNLFEALIGAIYLDRGYQKATEFIYRVLIHSKNEAPNWDEKVISYKSLMVEWCQKHKKTLAFETQKDEAYASKTPHFICHLMINGKVFTKGRDTSKKRAEEKASKRAFFRIKGKGKKTEK